jgi:hypothetical protein
MDVARPSAKPLLLSYVKEQNSARKEIRIKMTQEWINMVDNQSNKVQTMSF